MSNDSSLPGVWEASDWADTSQCPPSVGGATFLIVAYSAVIAIGLLGNAGLVFIIARQQELRNVTNILIANLSCSDILMCVVCLPVTVIYTLMDRWVLGEALCKVSVPHTQTHIHTHTSSILLINNNSVRQLTFKLFIATVEQVSVWRLGSDLITPLNMIT